MLFNSVDFLVFITLFFFAYFNSRGYTRLWICLAGSYVFYGWWDWRFLSLITLSTLVDYAVGLQLDKVAAPRPRKLLLILSMVVNLGMLATFKYFNFFLDSFIDVMHAIGFGVDQRHLSIILPVGISFYTFQTMSYTIDVYRRKIDVEQSLLRFATFVAFFPQLVAGPIVRAGTLLPQLRKDHPFDWDRFVSGFMLCVWGYFLKVGVADSLAPVVDLRYAMPARHTSLDALIGAIYYSFQIYGDFAGYSGIAIGLARMLGFDLGMNFNRPYFAHSASNFWERWHISLSSWMRDYLYIPLGGSRGSKLFTYRNVMITMLLSGLWHGASWRFVVWGGLNGFYVVVERIIGPTYRKAVDALRAPQTLTYVLQVLLIFALTQVTWVFFRAQSFDNAYDYLSRIASFDNWSPGAVVQKFHVLKGGFLVAFLVTLEILSFRIDINALFQRRPLLVIPAAAILIWMTALLGTFNANAFIYFQF